MMRVDFNFDIVIYPFMDSIIPISPADGVYVLRLILLYEYEKIFKTFENRYQDGLMKFHCNFPKHINTILSKSFSCIVRPI